MVKQQERVDQWRSVKAGYLTTQIQAITQNGLVSQIKISNPESRGFIAHRPDFKVQPGNAVLVLTADTAKANLGAFAQVSIERLDELKVDFKTRFVGLQNGIEAQVNEAQSNLREALVEFKKVLKGQNSY